MEIKHKSFGSVGSSGMSEPDLRSLIELGCIKETVKLGNLTFSIRTLSVVEAQHAASVFDGEPTNKQVMEFNFRLLAMAVEKVNNTPLEKFDDDSNETDLLARRINVLKRLQPSIFSKLLEVYENMTARANAQFRDEQVKK